MGPGSQVTCLLPIDGLRPGQVGILEEHTVHYGKVNFSGTHAFIELKDLKELKPGKAPKLYPDVVKSIEEIHAIGDYDPFLGDKMVPFKKVREILIRNGRGG